ncbi:MAG: hypothetical protein RBT11_05220 [Desulfobacterales bacterium]|jgi:hypothetical protein|nr:hypothetical protein [Desulfobacterales bacterium]
MQAIELISLRLHNSKDGPLVESTLEKIILLQSVGKTPPVHFELFQNPVIPNDWLVLVQRSAGCATVDKSIPAASLAESFRPLGRTHHAVWVSVQSRTQTPVAQGG